MGDLFRPDGNIINTLPANKRAFTMDELQAAVGGYVEIVGTSYSDANQKLIAIGDEDAKLVRKPANHYAGLIVGKSLAGDILFITEDEAAVLLAVEPVSEAEQCSGCGLDVDDCECD